MIAIIDYGAGNLGSVYKAFRYIGADVAVTSDPAVVERADRLVLPGVGAFTHCMQGLEGVHLTGATHNFIRTGRPFLGICVGLQMLFDCSEEMGTSPGLGILRGRVVKFDFNGQKASGVRASGVREESKPQTPNAPDGEQAQPSVLSPNASPLTPCALKIPHIGWNALAFREDALLFRGLKQGDRVYFVHSYYPEPEEAGIVSATTEYGYSFCCAVERDNIHATQFHPEKSGAVGLQILRNFAALTA